MQERDVEVLDLHDMLAQTLELPAARKFVLDRRITRNIVALGTAGAVRPWLDELPATQLAEFLIGGIADLGYSGQHSQEDAGGNVWRAGFPDSPDTQYLDSSAIPHRWIYNGVTLNQMYWPARKPETLLQRAVYKFHPRFAKGKFTIWWGDSDEDFTGASMEGGWT